MPYWAKATLCAITCGSFEKPFLCETVYIAKELECSTNSLLANAVKSYPLWDTPPRHMFAR
jgi:hypothetical protein